MNSEQPPLSDDPCVDDDDMLMSRVAIGDTAAISQLVEAKLPKTVALAWKIVGDRSEAEDIAQEVMLRLWQQAGNWQAGRASLASWIRRVALNLSFDRMRRRKWQSTADPVEAASSDPEAYQILASRQRSEKIRLLIKSLPERQQKAIWLHYFEEISQREAADTMGISADAFESLLRRARKSLNDELHRSNWEMDDG